MFHENDIAMSLQLVANDCSSIYDHISLYMLDIQLQLNKPMENSKNKTIDFIICWLSENLRPGMQKL